MFGARTWLTTKIVAIAMYQRILEESGMPKSSMKEHCIMSHKTYEFEAEIKKVPDLDGAYVEVPIDIKKEFGKGRVKVTASFDSIRYDGSIVNMGVKNSDGSICYIIGITKEIRIIIGKQAGDIVKVKIEALV